MSSHADDSPHFLWTTEGDVQTINIDPIVSRNQIIIATKFIRGKA